MLLPHSPHTPQGSGLRLLYSGTISRGWLQRSCPCSFQKMLIDQYAVFQPTNPRLSRHMSACVALSRLPSKLYKPPPASFFIRNHIRYAVQIPLPIYIAWLTVVGPTTVLYVNTKRLFRNPSRRMPYISRVRLRASICSCRAAFKSQATANQKPGFMVMMGDTDSGTAEFAINSPAG